MTQATAEEFHTWTDILPALARHDGVITCTVGALRDIDGYGRNGSNVRASIARRLSSLGVATLTEDLPHKATELLVLYKQGTPVSELVETLTRALAGGGSPNETAESLRRLNKVPDPESVMAAVDLAKNALEAAEAIMTVTP